jgi:hypothetical protein
MQTSEKAQARRLLEHDRDRYATDRKLHLGKNEWHETTVSREAVREELVNRLSRSSLGSDVGQYGVVDDQDKFKMMPVREL